MVLPPWRHKGRKEKKMTVMKFMELELQTLKEGYGEEFKKLTQEEKMNLMIIFANQTCHQYPELMQVLANSVYDALNDE